MDRSVIDNTASRVRRTVGVGSGEADRYGVPPADRIRRLRPAIPLPVDFAGDTPASIGCERDTMAATIADVADVGMRDRAGRSGRDTTVFVGPVETARRASSAARLRLMVDVPVAGLPARQISPDAAAERCKD